MSGYEWISLTAKSLVRKTELSLIFIKTFCGFFFLKSKVKKKWFCKQLDGVQCCDPAKEIQNFCLDLHKTVSLGIFLLILGYLIS